MSRDCSRRTSCTAARTRCALGPTEEIPWFKGQQRLTFARVGIVDPASVADYVRHGGYQGLTRALTLEPAAIVQMITTSGLRGRGGAAFPTGIKWKTVLDQVTAQKYVTCNADEGDSGTFADRMLMEGDPLTLIEGMTIAGIAVGATQGYIYLRAEYPHAHRALNTAIAAAYQARYLGDDVAGSGKRFDLEVRLGAGAYICGEETSMLESLEGKRGEVRVRPPLPAIKGLFGRPTIVNNVITLASVPWILAHGAEAYANYGMGKSRGTLPIQLAGNIRRGGLVERAFGITLRELLYDYGGGSASGRPIRTIQVGGPLGAYIPPAHFDTAVDYEALVCGRRPAGAWRNRGVRRYGGHGAHGALCDGVLRDRVLRQVHPLQDRLDARCRGHRPHPRRRGRGAQRATARGAVRDHGAGFPVRAGRHGAVPRAERAEALQGRFSRARASKRAQARDDRCFPLTTKTLAPRRRHQALPT